MTRGTQALVLLCASGLSACRAVPFARPPASGPETFRVQGRHLVDRCGTRVVLRGVNKMNIWTDRDGARSFPEIAKTGANSVRVVWSAEGSAAELDRVLANAVRHGLVPVVENHDATCSWRALPDAVRYWLRPDVLAVLKKWQAALVLNLANEAGEDDLKALVTDEAFIAGYRDAILQLRRSGLRCPLMIDAPACGRDLGTLERTWRALQASDPEHNVLFSAHAWWPSEVRRGGEAETRGKLFPRMDGDTLERRLERAARAGMPLVLGEFASEVPGVGPIDYRRLLSVAGRLELGWFAWSWGPGNLHGKGPNGEPSVLDMTSDNSVSSLRGWAREVVDGHPQSLRRTSVRPSSLTTGRCSTP